MPGKCLVVTDGHNAIPNAVISITAEDSEARVFHAVDIKTGLQNYAGVIPLAIFGIGVGFDGSVDEEAEIILRTAINIASFSVPGT